MSNALRCITRRQRFACSDLPYALIFSIIYFLADAFAFLIAVIFAAMLTPPCRCLFFFA